MCQALDVQTNGQIRRIRENEAIADALVPLVITRAYRNDSAQTREMLCLRLDRLPFWLGTLQPNRIKDEAKQAQVVRFQREFAEIAWAAFRSQILPSDMLAELDATLSPTQQEYLRLMDEAATLRQGVSRHEERLGSLEQRMADLEARLVGTDFINSAQMKEYTDMVGILAHLLRKKGKGNEATVHAEIKHQFQVPAYQLLPEAEFDHVKRYMRDWYRLYLKNTGYKYGPLFRAQKNSQGGSLSYQAVQQRWQHYCEQAGVACTLHQLRHSHATELVNEGVSLATIRKRLGHKNIQTTLHYAGQSDETADAELRAWRRQKGTRI